MISRLLASAIYALRPKRKPDFLIGPKGDPYMRRWWIIPRNRVFNIYMHHMRHDDDDRAPHDHPWWSLSLCLHGHIREIQRTKHGRRIVNRIHAGDWKWRGMSYIHRLELPRGDAWTLFITGPKLRTWGFHCPKGFVKWYDFATKEEGGSSISGGCGEME